MKHKVSGKLALYQPFSDVLCRIMVNCYFYQINKNSICFSRYLLHKSPKLYLIQDTFLFCIFPATNQETRHHSLVTSHQSPFTIHKQPVTNHQLPVTSYQSPVTPLNYLRIQPHKLHPLEFGRVWEALLVHFSSEIINAGIPFFIHPLFDSFNNIRNNRVSEFVYC